MGCATRFAQTQDWDTTAAGTVVWDWLLGAALSGLREGSLARSRGSGEGIEQQLDA